MVLVMMMIRPYKEEEIQGAIDLGYETTILIPKKVVKKNILMRLG